MKLLAEISLMDEWLKHLAKSRLMDKWFTKNKHVSNGKLRVMEKMLAKCK